jgi:phosphatidylglycerol lysyltransferase
MSGNFDPRRHGLVRVAVGEASATMAPTPHTQRAPSAGSAADRRLVRIAARASAFGQRVMPWVGLALFALALWSLREALSAHSYRELASALASLSGYAVAASIVMALAGYTVLVGLDVLALRHVRQTVPLRSAAVAALLSNALGNNIGNTLLTGSAVRFWVYTDAGLSARQVGAVVLFCSIGFWVGYLALAGTVLIAAPVSLPAVLQFGFDTSRALGTLLLVILAAWLGLCARRHAFTFGPWRIDLPSPALTLGQIAIECADLLLMAGALYVLLPATADIGFAAFLSVFLVALVAGAASQVPGGLGVFEAAMIALLVPRVEVRGLIAALLAFRAIYLLLPFLVGLGAAGVRGSAQLAPGAIAWLQRASRSFTRFAPMLLGAMAFVAGALLLLSGALPAAIGRLDLVRQLFDLPVIEVSHFLASLVGAALLVVARGLQRRLNAAWWVAAGLLAAGALLSLLKGWDFEEAFVLSGVLLALLPLRSQFYRRSSLFETAFSPAWLVSCAVVVGGSAWLMLFAHRDEAMAAHSWWQFASQSEATRSLRALIGAVALLVVFALHRLIRPAVHARAATPRAQIERARPIVERSPWTYANLVYRGDKALLFSDADDAFLMYGRLGRSWVAMGDPVGAEAGVRELAWRYAELVDRHDGWCAFFEVRPQRRQLYAELGLALTPLGEEARVDLRGFTLDAPAHRDLRQACAKLARLGLRFEIVGQDGVAALLPTLDAISRAWLERKATSEKGFSNASFDAAYLSRFPAAIVRHGDDVMAFANLWLGAGREELSVDLMRHRPEAPNGTMDMLFSGLFAWGRDHGYHWFNFGMAPLAGLEASAEAAVWPRVGAFIYRHAEHFYNFEGLRRYKAKFGPAWTPLYLASPGGLALTPVLLDVTALIAGGFGNIVAKRRARAP